MMRVRLTVPVFATTALAFLSIGCGSGGDGEASNGGGHAGAGGDASDGGGAGSGGADGSLLDVSNDGSSNDGFVACADGGCSGAMLCKHDTCVPDLGPCTSNDDCPGDSYCDADQTCVPYGVPADKTNDPTCERPKSPPGVAPAVQCEWAGPDPSDPTTGYAAVYTAPMVADLNLDLDPNKLQPSIVVTTFATTGGERIGMLRIFDGRTCAEQAHAGGPDDPNADELRPAYGSQWAIADLDGDVGVSPDGHPEIVGLHRMPGAFGTDPPVAPIAYKIDTSTTPPTLSRMWLGRTCAGSDGGADTPVTFSKNSSAWNWGAGVWDLDDDGVPEVVVDQLVFDANGCLLNTAAGKPSGFFSAVADVDRDGKPELVRSDGIFGWNATTKAWDPKPYFVKDATKHLPGYVAIVDVGAYSTLPGVPATDPLPEIVVVSPPKSPALVGTIRVQTLGGDVVFGPMQLYTKDATKTTSGGAPTASDFDGDGQVEFAAAGGDFYAVYDPDCLSPAPTAERPGGTCAKTDASLPAGILWARASQDWSSSSTGSSIFDFDGDGKAEVAYGDECYLRVYEGDTGDVLFSAPASTGTGFELPVIADVDGDFATEIVAGRTAGSPACPATDPLFPGSDPFVKRDGFVVLHDPQDRWVSSRPIWNQYAYSITHVDDEGRVPKSSQMKRNWEQPGLNNFRQNTQGALGKLALADLTVTLDDLSELCSGKSGTFPISAKVCNRGTNPVQDGAEIDFYVVPKGDAAALDGGLDGGAGALVCSATTATLLVPGQCTTVSCTGFVPPDGDLYVVADPNGTIADCHPGNNSGASARVLCGGVH